MRVLILGGGRRLGIPLAEALAAENHEIYMLNRDPHNRLARSSANIESMPWDGRSAENWAGLIHENTAIINLNEDLILYGTHNRAVLNEYLHASGTIAEAINRVSHKPAMLFQVSTIAYYGDCEDDMVIEQTPPGMSQHAQTCHTLEQAVAGLPVQTCVLRVGMVLDQRAGVLARIMEKAARQTGPVRDGHVWVSWVHQQDVLRALRFLLDDGVVEGPVNIVAPHPVTRQHLLDIVAETLGRCDLPGEPAAEALSLDESQRVIPQRLMSLGFHFRFPEAEDALRHLLLCS